MQLWLGLYDSAGTTLLATLRAKTAHATEYTTSILNRYLTTTTTAGYTCTGGERLVLEISVVGTPGPAAGGTQGHNWSLRFGANGAGGDLGENNTDTGATLNPWFELSPDLTFITPASVSAGLMSASSAAALVAAVTGTALVEAAAFTSTADGPVAELVSTPPLTLPSGAGDRYAAMNLASPWRHLAVIPGTSAAAQRIASLFFYSGLVAAPTTGWAPPAMAASAQALAASPATGAVATAAVLQANAAAQSATVRGGTVVGLGTLAASATAPIATVALPGVSGLMAATAALVPATVQAALGLDLGTGSAAAQGLVATVRGGVAVGAGTLVASATALPAALPAAAALTAGVATATALVPGASVGIGAALHAVPMGAAALAPVATCAFSLTVAAEVFSSSAAALPMLVLWGGPIPVEYTRVRPERVAQGSRETLPWRFDLSALLRAGESPVAPTATLTNMTTEELAPASLLGQPTIESVYLTQWLTGLEPGMTYRLWVGFTIVPSALVAWEMWLDIAVPPVGTASVAVMETSMVGRR